MVNNINKPRKVEFDQYVLLPFIVTIPQATYKSLRIADGASSTDDFDLDPATVRLECFPGFRISEAFRSHRGTQTPILPFLQKQEGFR